MGGVIELFQSFRWQDVLDMLIIAFVIYRLALLIRGTRAVQMLIGLAIVFLVYKSGQLLELYTIEWILDNFLSAFLLVIVVVFQHDIRRLLTQVGSRQFFQGRRGLHAQAVEEIVRASVMLANKRLGALIVLEREVGLAEYLEAGNLLDAKVSKELILSVFLPSSPLHDGALIIQQGRITAAGCFLPLTTNPNVSKTLGTRHRAAIGLTEESDAVVIVVSEEEGKISLVRDGRITRDVEAGVLRATLQQLCVA